MHHSSPVSGRVPGQAHAASPILQVDLTEAASTFRTETFRALRRQLPLKPLKFEGNWKRKNVEAFGAFESFLKHGCCDGTRQG